MPRARLAAVVLLAVLASACERGRAPPAQDAATSTPPTAAPVLLADVVETTPNYIVGISYPKSAAKYPELARALQAYADAARGELMQAVQGLGGQKPTAPYDLSLQFTGLVDTPGIVVVAADGSSYTGGAHGNPLVERFTWLPDRNELLTAEKLVVAPDGWQVVADAAREQLMTGLAQRLDADAVEGPDRAAMLENGSKMIADGTAPKAANFARFEPVVDADGRIRALRFVFPPYQVGPYSDGTRTADVPAAVLLPVLAPEYRRLFRGG